MAALKPPIAVITGPTATGKTAAALGLARHVPMEVINGDSRLFYRGMDIGTAKPSRSERSSVPHHLIDTLDPDQSTSLAEFQDQVYALIPQVLDRGRLPVIVGGTQQYINAIVEGWRIPRVSPQQDIRQRLEEEAARFGRNRVLKRLERLDPDAAASIGTNLRRAIRALEVIEVTGKPISAQQGKSEVPFEPLLIGLSLHREALYHRIDRRVHQMIAAGLVAEVQSLLDRNVPPTAPALSSIGYRQVLPFLAGEVTEAEMIERIQLDTHRLVRHQQTWLRKTPNLVQVDVSNPNWHDQLLKRVESHLAAFPLPGH
jgi:tRNA dimethylallyltransferase